VDQVRKEVFRLGRAQQALFAYLDTLAKALLTCVPEPPADAKPQAVARTKGLSGNKRVNCWAADCSSNRHGTCLA
jgi:hypothetical protein